MGLDKKRNLPETIGIYCLYILVGVIPLVFIYQSYDIFELAKLTVLRLTTLVMIGAWAVMCYRERRFIVARTPIDYFILVYLGVYTLATAFSGSILTSIVGDYGRFEGILTIYNYAAVFFLAGIFIRQNKLIDDRGEFIHSLMYVAVGAATLVSLYGVMQRFGLDFLSWSSAGTDITRAFSTTGNPLYTAAYLTIIISVAIVLFVEGVRGERSVQGTLALLGAAIVLMFTTLVLTFSRAGWGGMLVSIAVLVTLAIVTRVRGVQGAQGHGRMPHRANSSTVAMTERSNNQRSQIPIYIALLVAVIVVTAGAIGFSASKASGPTQSALNRLTSVFDFNGPAYADRVSMWKSSIAMIKDRPILGYGPDTFGTYYPKYRRLDIVTFEREVNKIGRPRHQNRPHMDILQQGVSAGILGMIAYAAMWAAFFWFAIKQVRHSERSEESLRSANVKIPRNKSPRDDIGGRYLAIGLIAGLVGYLLQIQFSFATMAVTPLAWLGMALVFSQGERGERREQGVQGVRQEPKQKNIIGFGSVIVLVVLVVLLGILSLRPIIADYYFDQAVTAYEHQDSFAMDNNLRLAEAFNPYEPEYSNYASNSFVEFAKQAGDPDTAFGYLLKAVEYSQRAIALNSDAPGFHYNMGNAEYYYSMIPGLDKQEAERTMTEALGHYLIAVKNDPNMSDYHFNLASAYMRFKKKDEAIKEIKAGLKIDPTRVDAKAWLKTLENEADQK